MPFNISDNPLSRFITTDKVIFYFAAAVFSYQIVRYKREFIENVPGVLIIFLILFSMAGSNYLAEFQAESWAVFVKELGYATYSLAVALALHRFEAIKTYLKWSFNLSLVLVIIATFNLVDLNDILPAGAKTTVVSETIHSQTTINSTHSKELVERESVLWFDANNFGYLIGVQIVYLIYLLLTEKTRTPITLFRYSVLFLFGVTLLRTLSRGATFSTLLGAAAVIMCTKGIAASKRLKLITVFAGVSFLYSIFAGMPSILLELQERFFLASGLLGNTRAAGEMSGLETVRMSLTTLAFNEFLQKPVFGWGSAAIMGARWGTSNHLGYLNILGKFGVVGFALHIILLYLIISRLARSIKYLKMRGDPSSFLGYCLIGMLAADLISGFFRGIFIIDQAGLPFAFYLAVDEMRRKSAEAAPQLKALNQPTSE
jgi:hypothetical protein